MTFVKTLAESPGLTTIPSTFFVDRDTTELVASGEEENVPVVDFALLTSSIPEHRSKAIRDLGNACKDWGFFMVVNHSVPERLMNEMFEAVRGFFALNDEEKEQYKSKQVVDTIRCGSSSNASDRKGSYWRDFLKVFTHPEFHCPHKPPQFREILLEYSMRIRAVVRELLKAISESLGLDPCYIQSTLNLDSGFQNLVANLYPPCPQPELTLGVPPHTDHGLLTLLIQNGVGGFQIPHNGKWVSVEALPNSILVNTADQLEVLTNGKYKSVVHRANVNSKATRISLAMFHGPSLDTVVNPAPELLEREGQVPAYVGMKYWDYLELQQSKKYGDCCLDGLRIPAA